MAPFPAAAHRTGLADLPHPALGQASRDGMHGASTQAHLMKVEHTRFPVHLGKSKAAGSSRELVPTSEKPPYPARYMPPKSRIRLGGVAKAEVLGPSQQQTVEPSVQFRPRRRVSPEKQSVDLPLEPLLGFL